MEHIFRQFDINKAEKKIEFTLIHDLDKQETKIIRPDGLMALDRLMIKKASETELNKYTPLEQYTGLKDKDGQLVFVGDRVQFTKNTNFTIIWDKERCGFYGIDDNGVDYLITCLVHMIKKHGVGKVIGHIHKEGNK